MNSNWLTYAIISLVSVTLLLGFLLLVVALAYRRALSRLYELQERELKMKNDMQHEADEIISKARAEAQRLIHEAEGLTAKQQSVLSEELKAFAQKQAVTAEAKLTQVITEMAKQMPAEISAGQEQAHKELAKIYQTEYESAKKEIELYKAQKLKEIDQVLKKVIGDAALKVLGTSLRVEDHTEQIIKSLEEAKKQNGFF